MQEVNKQDNKIMQISFIKFIIASQRKPTKFLSLKVAATNTRYVARSKFFGSLVHKENFGLIWQVVFKLGYLFC